MILTPKQTQKSNSEEDTVKDDDATVDSSDDIPSREKLKIKSEMHVEARLEELKKRKKRCNERSLPTQKEIDYDDAIQTPTEPPPTAHKQLLCGSPSRSRPRAHNSSKDDPMEQVQMFLTELPELF